MGLQGRGYSLLYVIYCWREHTLMLSSHANYIYFLVHIPHVHSYENYSVVTSGKHPNGKAIHSELRNTTIVTNTKHKML
jgi:hypothetical protein